MPKDCQISWRLHVNVAAEEQQDTSQHILDVSFLRHTLPHVWVSTSKMMSQGRCVWLGIPTKYGLLGAFKNRVVEPQLWMFGGRAARWSTLVRRQRVKYSQNPNILPNPVPVQLFQYVYLQECILGSIFYSC